MKRLRAHYKRVNLTYLTLAVVILIGLAFLLLYHLGSLTGGLSSGEIDTSKAVVGWHGIYHNPLNLPINFIRSIVFFIYPTHGQTLTRLPNTLFGLLSIINFSFLVYLWHGKRTAILAGTLFASAAWTLHVSRLASMDVMYLWGITTLLLSHVIYYQFKDKLRYFYINLFVWGILITIPGLIWLVIIDLAFQRSRIASSWKSLNKWWQRIIAVILPLLWLPLLVLSFRSSSLLKQWVGLPNRFPSLLHILKDIIAVPFHLFIRGPKYPTLWLGKVPVLDFFVLAMAVIGIYFYAQNYKSSRSRLLGSLFLVSALLVGLGGSVSFSLVVPFAYLMASTGITYLLRSWMNVFPLNPLARSLGVTLIVLAVTASCIYNLRSYFIAWPGNPDTKANFNRRL